MIITRTPLRVSFFGGGTDYPAWFQEHGGAVLATSIDKYLYLHCRYLPQFFDYKSRIVWSQIECVTETSQIAHPAIRGILEWMKITEGVEIHHHGDLPALVVLHEQVHLRVVHEFFERGFEPDPKLGFRDARGMD